MIIRRLITCALIGHMALVSDDPGGQSGAMGVITLEDVIEELIGEVQKRKRSGA